MRINFTDGIKTLAAKKVNYLCSCPDCRRITIGSHSIKNSPLPNANAAHIYPASINGPRYDSSVLESFIKSEENCLWLCPTHHDLVDKDENRYGADLLLGWKKDAEDFANRQLEVSTIRFGEIKDKIWDIDFLIAIFNEYIGSGKFLQLLSIIQRSEENSKDSNLIQLFALYRIISYSYVSSNLVEDEINHFFSIENSLVKEKLFIFLIENNAKHILGKLQMLTPDKYKDIVRIIIDKQIIGKIIVFENVDKQDVNSVEAEHHELINRLLLNYFFTEEIGFISIIVPFLLKNEVLFEDNFVFKIRWIILKLLFNIQKQTFDSNNNSEYTWLKSIENGIYALEVNLQIDYWKFMLTANPESHVYHKILENIPSLVMNNPSFEFFLIASELSKDENNVDINNLVEKSIDSNDFNLLLMYLYKQYHGNVQILDRFFVKYSNLLISNVDILALYHMIQAKKETPIEIEQFVSSFESFYKDEIVYHCILADLYHIFGYEDKPLSELLLAEQLFKKKGSLSLNGLDFYLDIIDRIKAFDRAECLIGILSPIDSQIKLASILLSADDTKLLQKGYGILQRLYDENIRKNVILNGIGFYHSKTGNMLESRKMFEDSFLLKPNDYAALNLFSMKISNGESLSKDEILYADSSKDVNLCKTILSYYHIKNEVSKVKETYFKLFSIIDDSDIAQINSFFGFIVTNFDNDKHSNYVQTGYTIELKNNETLFLSIHNEFEWSKLINYTFFGSIHLSENDPNILNLRYKNIDEKVLYKNDYYKIVSIVSNELYLYRRAYEVLLKEGRITLVKADANNPDEALKSIFDIVKDGSNYYQEIMDMYDENQLIPLTFLSKKIGKSLLVVMEYLFNRPKVKIYNNLENNIDKRMLLSYDSIIPLLKLSKKISKILLGEFYVTQSIKAQLIVDIENEIIDNQNSNKSGFLTTIEEKMSFTEYNEEMKRSRLEYLVLLKEFVKSIKTISSIPKIEYCDENLEGLKSMGLDLEYEMFTHCLQNEDFVILTDNPLITKYANGLKLRTTGFASIYDLDVSNDINVSDFIKIMVSLNYATYLPLSIINKIMANYRDSTSEGKSSLFGALIEILDGTALSTEKDFLISHKNLVISLFATCVQTGINSGPIFNELRNKSLEYLKELYPEKYMEIVSKIRERFF